jgi:hypothetical protein
VGWMGEVVANCLEPGQGASIVTKGDLTFSFADARVCPCHIGSTARASCFFE